VSTAVSFEVGVALAEARALYQDGRLTEAEHLVRQIIKAYPNNAEALYLLGAVAYRAQQFDMSARHMQRVLALQPRHHDAMLTLGMAYRMQKKTKEALAVLRKAATMKPSSFDGRYHLALAELESGDLPAGAKHLERAVKENPESAAVRNTYAGVLYQLGNVEESLRQLRKAAQLAPQAPDLQQNLAVALQNNGMHEEAVEQFRKVLALQPDHFDAMYGLANSLVQMRQLDEAYALFQTLLKHGPKMVPPRSNYGLALRHGNRPHESAEQLRQALTDSHGEPFIAANLAESLIAAGNIDEALKVLRASFESRPTGGIMLQLGDLLARLGKTSEAIAQFERVLQQQADNAVALVSLLDIFGKDLPRSAQDQLEILAANEKRIPADRARAHLALGRLHDARGEYDRAFQHLSDANKMRANWQPFDMAAFRAWISKQIAAFDAATVAAKRGMGNDSDLPVFIVGLPRSGASIAERMIAAHPHGWGIGEPQDLYVLARRLPPLIAQSATAGMAIAGAASEWMSGQTAREYPDCIRDLTAESGRAVADEFVALRQRHAPKAKRVADKSAVHWQFVGLANVLFPRAAVVHVVRDPLDTMFSIFGFHLPGEHPFPSDLTALGTYWREYQRLMNHWRSVAPMTEITYEDLVRAPDATAKSLLGAVGLPWDASVLKFSELARPVTTQTRTRLRQPLDATRVGFAKNYGDFLKPLRDALAK
jgi:tetratricopeptide (TPR) repeat protein